MRLLLTSSGIKNSSIRDALVDLLGKPIAESNALFIPTAIYPFPGGQGGAWQAISGKAPSPLAGLGWKSLGILELSVLPSIEKAAWVPTVRDADALLFWGGDPLFLANWMRRSGLTDLLPTLRSEAVYVGVSAGAMAASSTFVETYVEPPRGKDGPLKSEDVVFTTPQGDVDRILVTGQERASLTLRSSRTWTTWTTSTLPWRTQRSGRHGILRRRTRSTTRPPSR